MKLAPLHSRFLDVLASELPGWKFVARHRHFKQQRPGKNLYIQVAFINHVSDFDATIDVAVEFLEGKDRLCIIGASLGNIEDAGQVRYKVQSPETAATAAYDAAAHCRRIGFPFLEHYAEANNVIKALKGGGSEARLISPFESSHAGEIAALESLVTPN